MHLRMICRPKDPLHITYDERKKNVRPFLSPHQIQPKPRKPIHKRGKKPPFFLSSHGQRQERWRAMSQRKIGRSRPEGWYPVGADVPTPGHGKGDGARWIQVIWRRKACFLAPNDAGDTGRGRSERSERSSAPTGYRPSGPWKPAATPAAPRLRRGRGRK